MANPTGLRIRAIHNQRTDAQTLNDEYVIVVNGGTQIWRLARYSITDELDQQLGTHDYIFPEQLTNGDAWHFEPGAAIFLMTGSGDNVFIADPGAGLPPQLHFHWNRTSFVWNNSGDRVYLRHPNGTWATDPFPAP